MTTNDTTNLFGMTAEQLEALAFSQGREAATRADTNGDGRLSAREQVASMRAGIEDFRGLGNVLGNPNVSQGIDLFEDIGRALCRNPLGREVMGSYANLLNEAQDAVRDPQRLQQAEPLLNQLLDGAAQRSGQSQAPVRASDILTGLRAGAAGMDAALPNGREPLTTDDICSGLLGVPNPSSRGPVRRL